MYANINAMLSTQEGLYKHADVGNRGCCRRLEFISCEILARITFQSSKLGLPVLYSFSVCNGCFLLLYKNYKGKAQNNLKNMFSTIR